MKEMTSLERVMAVMEGKTPDRLPVIPQSFMFAANTAGYRIGQINRNPAVMAECHLQSVEKYGYDGIVIDVDDAALAEACGAKVIFREDNVAVVKESEPCLKSLKDIDSLKIPDPLRDGRLSEWLETTNLIAKKVGHETAVMGRADQGPFSLLCLLRGSEPFMLDLLSEEEDVVLHAMEWATKVHILFAKAQLEAGAHITSMGDAYASPNLISPMLYKKYAFPFEKMVVEAVQTKTHPYSIHICGNTSKIIEAMGATKAKILEVDWKLDIAMARESIPKDTVLMGNIDPSAVMYLGTPQLVKEQVKTIIQVTKGKGLIISSGCALGANTKSENVAAMVEAAKEYGSYDQIMELQK